MQKIIVKFFNTDISNPLVNNLIIFGGTYLFITLSCILMCKDITCDTAFCYERLQIITDALIPTTITFSISVIIQNLSTAIVHQITTCSMTLITILCTLCYMMFYSIVPQGRFYILGRVLGFYVCFTFSYLLYINLSA